MLFSMHSFVLSFCADNLSHLDFTTLIFAMFPQTSEHVFKA